MPFTLLLASTGSGGGFLSQTLAGHPEVEALPFLFHPEREDRPEEAFWDYCNRRFLEEGLKLPGALPLLTKAYFAEEVVQRTTARGCVILPVLAQDLYLADGPQPAPGSHPELLQFAASLGGRFIHLIRENLLALQASRIRRELLNRKVPMTRHAPVEVPCATLLDDLRRIDFEQQEMRRFLNQYPQSFSLSYEAFYRPDHDQGICPSTVRKLLDFLEVSREAALSPEESKRSSTLLRRSISNYSEVEATLGDTRYRFFLDPS
ncbi:MAG: hypothetical protein AAF555_11350 [Verrucomicrobiota bacterium]